MSTPKPGTVVQIIKPDEDSQYRLRACKTCGSQGAQYVQYAAPGGGLLWRIECPACGATVDLQTDVRHDLQMAWNKEAKT